MSLFRKSAEEYLHQIIRMAAQCREQIARGEHKNAIRLLQEIVKIDERLYYEISVETGSHELSEQALRIRAASRDALNDAQRGEYDKVAQAIGKILASGEAYLNSEVRFVGYSLEEYSRSRAGQARFLSDLIEGITVAQATDMLTIAHESGLDIVIGGSSITKNQIGGDLDVGFKFSDQCKQDYAELREIVGRVVNKINKRCFSAFQRLFRKPLVEHKWLHDQSAVLMMKGVGQVEQFFMRRGFRVEPQNVLKDGRPFGPSGYALFRKDGGIVLVMPKYAKGVVGDPKFW